MSWKLINLRNSFYVSILVFVFYALFFTCFFETGSTYYTLEKDLGDRLFNLSPDFCVNFCLIVLEIGFVIMLIIFLILYLKLILKIHVLVAKTLVILG